MGSITRSQALLVSHGRVLGSYLKTNPCDQLLPRLPKMAVEGDGLRVTDIDTLGSATFVGSGGTVNDTATTWETTVRKYFTRRMATKVEVAGDIAQNVSMINDVFELQIQSKMVSMWNLVGSNLIAGTDTDPDPAGLETFALINPAGVLSPQAGANTAMTLTDYERMIEAVCPWDGGQPRYFVMNSKQYKKLLSLARAGGFTLDYTPDPILGRPLACYGGVHVLVSDWITNAEGVGLDETSVYLVHLGEREGDSQMGGLVWFYSEDTGPGIRVDGPHRNSGTDDLLFADLDLNIGFATLSRDAVLRLGSIDADA